MAELIRLTSVYHSFPTSVNQEPILKNISLDITDGETLAITGPSGSGKSTLLSILGLLDTATQGEYLLREQEINSLSRRQKSIIRNRHIGWIFQNFSLIGDMTALENVALPLRFNHEIAKSTYREKAEEALLKVGLADKKNSRPCELSGGQQQRVAIARALVNQPGLILADEPTGNLDSSTGQEIIKLLLSFASLGTTVIIVTHDQSIATRCQRIIRLIDGVIVNV